MPASKETKATYNLREKQLYHEYRTTHGPVKGGQKGFRSIVRSYPLSQRPLSLLTPYQWTKRGNALSVLARSRRSGESLTKAARAAHISPETVRRYLGESAFQKRGARWKATPSDALARRMSLFENGQVVTVSIRDSRTASLIGKYDRDVKTFLEDPARDPSILKRWKGQTFRDAAGNLHTFETDPTRLREAAERAETELGGFEVYPEGEETGEAVAYL
jgi:hypothetical protein